jgi:acetyltransferase
MAIHPRWNESGHAIGRNSGLRRKTQSMTIRNLEFLFKPRSVALIGASEQPTSLGAALTRNLCSAGFQGDILLVSQDAREIQGRPTYCAPSQLPHAPDLAVIATPIESVPKLIAELGDRGTKAAVVISLEVVESVQACRQTMLAAAKPHLLRIVGPECRGVLVPSLGLNIGLNPIQPLPGNIAFIAQSGAVVMAVLDWAYARGIGFSHLIALGSMVDVDFGDLLDYLTREQDTHTILLYIESITQARKFMSAARAAARVKPVIVLKAGPQADPLYDAAFQRAGMLRVYDLDELFGAVKTLTLVEPVYGDRLAILANGSGISTLATDTLRKEAGRLAQLAPATLERLSQVLPSGWSPGNPVDILDDAPASRYADALGILLQDPGIDTVLVLNCPTALASSIEAATAVIAVIEQHRTQGSRNPCVFTNWLSEGTAQAARRAFAEHRIPTYATPGDAVHAFMNRIRHRRNRETLMQTPSAIPEDFTPDTEAVRQVISQALTEGRAWLTELEAKLILSAYRVPVVPTYWATNPEEAAAVAAECGVPVALKIQAANIRHKRDVGGVALALETPAVVRENATSMWERIGSVYPDARPLGFTVQPMINRPQAHELMAGAVEDPLFGPVILFGHGGPIANVMNDRAVALPPLNLHLAREVMGRTWLYPLLVQGYGGIPGADLDSIALTLVKISQLVIDMAEIVEIDINPLLADKQGVLALGSRIRVARAAGPASQRLTIRPYPKELEETITLADGRRFQLRPVRPEDEPALQAAFAKLSPEEIYLRFLHFIKTLTHTAAARFTQIDYDREMALVLASQGEHGITELYGVVRLVADPDKERAEFAIIIGSILTGMGLGSLLMRRMIDYARSEGIKEIYGDVLRENEAMLKLSQAFGFTVQMDLDDASLRRVVLKL